MAIQQFERVSRMNLERDNIIEDKRRKARMLNMALTLNKYKKSKDKFRLLNM